jgi:crotonobetainyl-CoA:carnitine CoA-transferase CaiB-like acyl-CoA transferase
MALALEGIRVIDLTQYQQGPYATMMLADMGADVIKVEQRGTGDPGRKLGPLWPGGTPAYMEANDRNKKSITVDLRKEKGKEIVYRLVKEADVFAQNYRPGVADRLGLGYEAISHINPGIVYLTGSAFGLKGPMGKSPGYDGVGQAMSGLLDMTWAPEGVPPASLGFSISDQCAAFQLAFGAMVALFQRERTGVGQQVDTSLLASTMNLIGWTFQSHLVPGGKAKRFVMPRARLTQFRSEAGVTSSHYAKDGKPIMILMVGREFQEKSFRVMGLEDFIGDARFATGEKVIENREALLTAIDQRIATKTRDEWLKLFGAAGAIAAPINTPVEAAEHPQVVANEYVVEIDHPDEGKIKVLGLPIKLHKTPGRVGIAPKLGEHTDQILAELGGYTAEEISRLRQEEVI